MCSSDLKLEKRLGELLNEINQICSDSGITYFLYGRTLAEALLYEGFCPEKCTDPKSISICMLSSDFEKFKNLIINSNIEDRVLDGFDINEDSTVMGGRYIDTSIAYSTEPHNIFSKTFGVYIDITVIDTVSGDEETFSNYALDLAYLNDVIDPATDYGIDMGINAKKIISSGMRAKGNLPQVSVDLEEGEVKNIKKMLFPRSGHLIKPLSEDVFARGRTARFLGDDYPVPKQSVRLLIALYGDEWETVAFKETAVELMAPLSRAADIDSGVINQKEFIKSLKNRKMWLAKNAELLSESRRARGSHRARRASGRATADRRAPGPMTSAAGRAPASSRASPPHEDPLGAAHRLQELPLPGGVVGLGVTVEGHPVLQGAGDAAPRSSHSRTITWVVNLTKGGSKVFYVNVTVNDRMQL